VESASSSKPTARARRGDLLEVEIESLAFGGRGVARAEGFVVFVAGGLPGDRVRVEVTKAKKRFAEARTVELLAAAPDRLADVCQHGDEPCPGAPWQGLAYERQLEVKSEQVDEALRRIGELEGFELEPIVAAEEKWRYRNKLEYSFGEEDDQPTLGFHARGRWDLIVDVEDCHLASEAGNAARNAVREWARAEAVPAYDARSRRGVLRNLAVREGRRTGQIQTRLVTAAEKFPRPPVDLHTVIEGDSGSTDGPTGALGEERLRERLCGLDLEMSHSAFFQTNTEMAERLYAVAAEFAGLSGRERVFDLFCGIGTIGLSMAGQAGEVWGLEIVPEAIADAERNAERNRIENAHFVAANARTGMRPLLEQAGKPDVVVIDPPRAGLSQKIVRRVIECEAPRIVYVSCNPTTLAPNAAQLAEAGYRLTRVRPVDMFPQTPHIECVALLEKDAAASATAASVESAEGAA
jgi:23S rRNA (uracil1939-C5)-methyltransferase